MMVGVHIRHGMDISMNSRNRIHGHVDTPIEYYKRAIQQISKIYENVWLKIKFEVRIQNKK